MVISAALEDALSHLRLTVALCQVLRLSICEQASSVACAGEPGSPTAPLVMSTAASWSVCIGATAASAVQAYSSSEVAR